MMRKLSQKDTWVEQEFMLVYIGRDVGRVYQNNMAISDSYGGEGKTESQSQLQQEHHQLVIACVQRPGSGCRCTSSMAHGTI